MSISRLPLIAALLLVCFGSPLVIAQKASTPGQATTSAPAAKPQPAEVIPGADVVWSLAAAGDAIFNRRIVQFDNDSDPRFRAMVKIIRGADVAMLNLEQSLFRLSEFTGWGEVENGGNWEVGPPDVALDLKAMGFDMVNRANNHTTDYGVEGMRVTDKWLDEIGIVHAGTGMNLGQASRPGYFESSKGRVALIGLATTFTPMSRAGAARAEMRGRPGLNALRVTQRYEVDGEAFKALKAASSKLSAGAGRSDAPDVPIRLFGATIHPGNDTRIIETVNASDEARILREVKNAARLADFVIVTSHSHEPGNNSVAPPPWLKEFAHKCIDAGAAAYVVHGPHQLRGVEIYKGRPIFYSLGNFIFQNETIDPMPADSYEQYGLPETALASDVYDARFRNGTTGFPASGVWYQSVVAVPVFQGLELREIRMYPIDLQWKAPRSQRGSPRLAAGAVAKEIGDRLIKLSADLGTTMTNDNGILVWRAQSASSSR